MASQTPQDLTRQRAAQTAERLQQALMKQPFGIIRFWGFAVVRPNDQSYLLVAVHQEQEHLDLSLTHESGQGSAGVLSIWEPGGLETITETGRTGIILHRASRLKFGDREAWLEGDQYRIRTPRGEGGFAVGDSPALTLAR